MKKKLIGIFVLTALFVLLAVGCDEKKETVEKWDEEVTLTWWIVGGDDKYYQHYWSEMASWKELQERTGINVEFEVAINYEAYLPMMSAKTYPHIITAGNLSKYPGRMAALHDDGISIALNDYMDEYMPNFKAIVEEYPQIGQDVRLNDGVYTFLSTLYDVNDDAQRALTSKGGLMIRADWLENVGMDIPTDMSEWYTVLKAFKMQDPNGNGEQDEEPFIACSSGWKYFLPAYGIDDDPSIMTDENGKEYVVYGFMTDNYKEYLAEMNKWHTEGLLYNMFEGTSLEKLQERVTQNFAGSWKGNVNHIDSTLSDSFINQLKEKAPDVSFAAVPWPKTADGYQWCFSDISSFHADTTVITDNAVKDGVAEAAAYFIDYLLSEEGSTLLTWGIEGESYEVVGGEKQLLDGMNDMVDFYGKKITKLNTYADNLTVAFPSRADIVAELVFAQKSEEYKETSYTWAKGDTSYKMLAPCQLSTELEAEVDALVQGDMKGYVSKMRHRFITGRIPLTEYDTYVEQVKLLGGDKYQEIWQKAYDEYVVR